MSRSLLDVLRAVSPIPDEEADELQKLVRIDRFAPGELFTRIGDQSTRIGIVLEGLFRVYYVTSEGDLLVRAFCLPHQVVGSFATLETGDPSQVSTEALEHSAVASVDFRAMTALYERHACWERLGRKLAERYYRQLEWRVYQFLAYDATERYQLLLKEHPGLEGRVSRANIASYLGITPVSLSRIAAALKG